MNNHDIYDYNDGVRLRNALREKKAQRRSERVQRFKAVALDIGNSINQARSRQRAAAQKNAPVKRTAKKPAKRVKEPDFGFDYLR